MAKKPTSPKPTAPFETARVFATAAEAAIANLELNRPLGMGPLHQALASRIRHAAAQLLAVAEELAGDQLMVAGSMGQRRPHPLLKTLQELRKEIASNLTELTFRAEQEAMLVQAKALTRRAPEGEQS